ncbi:hypothetical protein GGR57DRAFT_301403 [Xylariaceae sp. FL1272]|nr:hypothetical protein GGR57DRAFT_301403 [Xylariaceae sp. FL1272]
MSQQRAIQNTTNTRIPQYAGSAWVLSRARGLLPFSSAPTTSSPHALSRRSSLSESLSEDEAPVYFSFPEYRETVRRGLGGKLKKLFFGSRWCRCDYCEGVRRKEREDAHAGVESGEEGGVGGEAGVQLGPDAIRRLEQTAEQVSAAGYGRLRSESGSVAESIGEAMSTPIYSPSPSYSSGDRLSRGSMEVPIMLDWQTLAESSPEVKRRSAAVALGPDHPFLCPGPASPILRHGEFPRMRGEVDPASVPSPPGSRAREYFDRVFSRGDEELRSGETPDGTPSSLVVEIGETLVVRPTAQRVEPVRRPSMARRLSSAVLGRRGSGFSRRSSLSGRMIGVC